MNKKMKKLLVLLCSLTTTFSLVACSTTNETSNEKTVTFAKELDVISMDYLQLMQKEILFQP